MLILPPVLLRPFRCKQCSARHFGFFFRKRGTPPSGMPDFPGREAR